ncbi:MAG: 3'-phosphoadenosine 5'-phosphosulfate sulfotransferase [Tremellales sp. Tagirdzhanova-0007]|nr:MAG: 3'-phosphoadenosine 5'-phosphosulfate sulfotransferase [Tremellales sp. Tagirdzhanova-0007]
MSSVISTDELNRVLKRAKSSDPLGLKIAQALDLINGVLHDLGEEAVAISFNGGKDCMSSFLDSPSTVLLHLFAAVLHDRHSTLCSPLLPDPAELSRPLPQSSTPIDLNFGLNGYHSSTISTHLDDPKQSLPLPDASSTSSSTTSTHLTGTSTITYPYPPIRSIYITAPNPFSSLEVFVLSSALRYGLDLYRFGGGMKAALSDYLKFRSEWRRVHFTGPF